MLGNFTYKLLEFAIHELQTLLLTIISLACRFYGDRFIHLLRRRHFSRDSQIATTVDDGTKLRNVPYQTLTLAGVIDDSLSETVSVVNRRIFPIEFVDFASILGKISCCL